ncbi:MAG: NAD(P)H-dependent oxidoreductase subunit E [Armatimonadota bacterium]|nr:NAD(P)H-dependent oxidoreductase subunit E [Armatimonadota bacterium]
MTQVDKQVIHVDRHVFALPRLGIPPCQAACPIHQNAQGYIALVYEGKFEEALKMILRDNPLPAVCGRVCTHPCTVACSRATVDEAIHIPGIKRFVVDHVLARGGDYQLPRPRRERPERVAIVGSGPAGLMCAYELRQRGYQTVVFEALPMAGGMLAVGVPEFRLPRRVLQREIGKLEEIGVRINLNTPVGPQGIPLERLRTQYDAVFVAIGAHVERRLEVPGEDLPGVWGGLEFLRRIKLGEAVGPPLVLGRRVCVIGGGNSALDAARTALRAGAEEVRLFYRRTRAEMPADPAEIDEAQREGVTFDFLAAPKAILGTERVRGVEFLRMQLGPPDESGRPSPIAIPGSEFVVDCDAVIVTIGQVPDLQPLGERLGLRSTRWGTLDADPLTLQTNVEGVFAGGDCVSGPDVIVAAMAAGKKAAISIDRFLSGLDLRRVARELVGGSPVKVETQGIPARPRVPMPAIELGRRGGFEEVHTGYCEELARAEASRCLECASGGDPLAEPLPRELAAILERHRGRDDVLVIVLQQVQAQYGYLSERALRYASRELDISLARMYGVATFYNQFRFTPPGRVQLQVCCGTACHVGGAPSILERLKAHLQIAENQTTPDGVFTLQTVFCVGCCSLAPVVIANGAAHGRMTPGRAESLARDLRAAEEGRQ